MDRKTEKFIRKTELKLRSGDDVNDELGVLYTACAQGNPYLTKDVISPDGISSWDLIGKLTKYLADRVMTLSLKMPERMFKKTCDDIEACVFQLRRTLLAMMPQYRSDEKISVRTMRSLGSFIPSDELPNIFEEWSKNMLSEISRLSGRYKEHASKDIFDISLEIVVLTVDLLYIREAFSKK